VPTTASFLGLLRYYCDARLESCEFDWVRETWTHEQIMDLIVGGGKYVHPDDVKVGSLNDHSCTQHSQDVADVAHHLQVATS
jgi:hypothetical protein